MRNDPNRADQRHEPHRITRLLLRLLYPTHYKDSTDVRSLYFLQREWRIIRRDSELDQFKGLTNDDRTYLRDRNESFFGANINVWSEDAGAIVAQPRINATYKLSAPFVDIVSEIIVPTVALARVQKLNPGVRVTHSEQYEYGFHQ
jgi:hypothetical protein